MKLITFKKRRRDDYIIQSQILNIRAREMVGLVQRLWSLSETGLPGIAVRPERPSLLDLLSEFGLISDGWLGSISPLEIGPMHLSVEGLRP